VTQEIGENQFSAEIGQFYGSILLDSATAAATQFFVSLPGSQSRYQICEHREMAARARGI
jgi:hypothetical protein